MITKKFKLVAHCLHETMGFQNEDAECLAQTLTEDEGSTGNPSGPPGPRRQYNPLKPASGIELLPRPTTPTYQMEVSPLPARPPRVIQPKRLLGIGQRKATVSDPPLTSPGWTELCVLPETMQYCMEFMFLWAAGLTEQHRVKEKAPKWRLGLGVTWVLP